MSGEIVVPSTLDHPTPNHDQRRLDSGARPRLVRFTLHRVAFPSIGLVDFLFPRSLLYRAGVVAMWPSPHLRLFRFRNLPNVNTIAVEIGTTLVPLAANGVRIPPYDPFSDH